MKTIIHINKYNIARNIRGAKLPVITVKTYRKRTATNRVRIHGPSDIIYNPRARIKAWVETHAMVEIMDEADT